MLFYFCCVASLLVICYCDIANNGRLLMLEFLRFRYPDVQSCSLYIYILIDCRLSCVHFMSNVRQSKCSGNCITIICAHHMPCSNDSSTRFTIHNTQYTHATRIQHTQYTLPVFGRIPARYLNEQNKIKKRVEPAQNAIYAIK